MSQITDIVRAGPGALHLHMSVPLNGLLNRLLGRTRSITYLRVGDRWYDPEGWRVQPGPELSMLEDWRLRWNEGRNPVILWDEV